MEPIRILDGKVIMLENKDIKQVNLHWNYLGPDAATWELEEQMKVEYPFLF